MYYDRVESEHQLEAPKQSMRDYLLARRKALNDIIKGNPQYGQTNAEIIAAARQSLLQSNLTTENYNNRLTLSHFTRYMTLFIHSDEILADGSRDMTLNPELKRDNRVIHTYDINKILFEGTDPRSDDSKLTGDAHITYDDIRRLQNERTPEEIENDFHISLTNDVVANFAERFKELDKAKEIQEAELKAKEKEKEKEKAETVTPPMPVQKPEPKEKEAPKPEPTIVETKKAPKPQSQEEKGLTGAAPITEYVKPEEHHEPVQSVQDENKSLQNEPWNNPLLLQEYEIVYGITPKVTALEGEKSPAELYYKRVAKERSLEGSHQSITDYLLRRRKRLDEMVQLLKHQPNNATFDPKIMLEDYSDHLTGRKSGGRAGSEIVTKTRQSLMQSNLTPENYVKRLTLTHFLRYMKHFIEGNELFSDGSRDMSLNPSLKRNSNHISTHDVNDAILSGKIERAPKRVTNVVIHRPKKEPWKNPLLMEEYRIVYGVAPKADLEHLKAYCKRVIKEHHKEGLHRSMTEYLLRRLRRLDRLVKEVKTQPNNATFDPQVMIQDYSDHLTGKKAGGRAGSEIVMKARQSLMQSNLAPENYVKRFTLTHFLKYIKHFIEGNELASDSTRNMSLNPDLKRRSNTIQTRDLNEIILAEKSSKSK